MRRRLAAGVALALLLQACRGDSGGVPATVVRDSSGVAVVEHGAVDYPTLPAWRLADRPDVSIGVVEGDEAYQFARVEDARLLRDGAIAVLDRGRRLRTFDPTGAHRWTAGGEGDGPGEFRYATMVREVRGDSLVVWDVGMNRFSLFSADGGFARTATVPDLDGNALAWGLATPDRLLVEVRHFERTRIGGHEALRTPSDFLLVDLEGAVVRRLGRRLYGIGFQEVDEGGAFSEAIFAASAVLAPAPEGLWYGDAESYELRLEAGPDRVRRIVRWDGPDRTFTEEDVAAVLEVWAGGPDADPEIRRFIEAYGRTHPRADRYAAYEELRVDDAGRLWLRDFVRVHEDDGLRRWTAFSADGTEILGRLTHPEAVVHHIGADRVVVAETDELDVERVRIYRILRDTLPAF